VVKPVHYACQSPRLSGLTPSVADLHAFAGDPARVVNARQPWQEEADAAGLFALFSKSRKDNNAFACTS